MVDRIQHATGLGLCGLLMRRSPFTASDGSLKIQENHSSLAHDTEVGKYGSSPNRVRGLGKGDLKGLQKVPISV
jgi:hypothetical protein